MFRERVNDTGIRNRNTGIPIFFIVQNGFRFPGNEQGITIKEFLKKGDYKETAPNKNSVAELGKISIIW